MKNLKNIKTLVLLSFFIALSIVASKFFAITTVSQKVGLEFVVTALMCSIFSPQLAIVASIIIDLVANLLFPTPGGFYLPFVITKITTALIYTFFFYRKDIKRKNIILAISINTLITSLFLNTLWVSQLTGNPFTIQFVARIPSMASNYVLHILVLLVIFPKLSTILRKEVKRLGAQPENAPY